MSGSAEAFSDASCEGGTQVIDNLLDMVATKAQGGAAAMFEEVASNGNAGISQMRNMGGDLASSSYLPDCNVAAQPTGAESGAMAAAASPSGAPPDMHTSLLAPEAPAAPTVNGAETFGFTPDAGSMNLHAEMPGGTDLLGGAGQGLNGMVDSALGTGDPMGLLGKVFEFIMSLFSSMGEQLSQILPNIDLYEQGASAALDAAKFRN